MHGTLFGLISWQCFLFSFLDMLSIHQLDRPDSNKASVWVCLWECRLVLASRQHLAATKVVEHKMRLTFGTQKSHSIRGKILFYFFHSLILKNL
jgi:hypothetical protein